MLPPDVAKALSTWHALNHALRSCTEAFAQKLLDHEMDDLRRPQFVHRIHARMNKLRRIRERNALDRKITKRPGSSRDRLRDRGNRS